MENLIRTQSRSCDIKVMTSTLVSGNIKVKGHPEVTEIYGIFVQMLEGLHVFYS